MSQTAASNAPAPPFPTNSTEYCVEFVGNNSKSWDGKRAWLEKQWLEDMYTGSQLSPGSKISLPWPGKGGKIKHWNAIVVGDIRGDREGQGTYIRPNFTFKFCSLICIFI